MHPFELEKYRLHRYRAFADLYGVDDLETLVKLYEIEDLEAFLPAQPSPTEKQALNQLVGVKGVEGYMDYAKVHNTFELIMQWQEMSGNVGRNAIFFTQDA
ncbi:MAG: hypothetical protein OHK0039_14570 [Bacteroidia bacterium]